MDEMSFMGKGTYGANYKYIPTRNSESRKIRNCRSDYMNIERFFVIVQFPTDNLMKVEIYGDYLSCIIQEYGKWILWMFSK